MGVPALKTLSAALNTLPTPGFSQRRRPMDGPTPADPSMARTPVCVNVTLRHSAQLTFVMILTNAVLSSYKRRARSRSHVYQSNACLSARKNSSCPRGSMLLDKYLTTTSFR